jgi:hypothetical protein
MSKEIIPVERVAQSIRWIREQKVLLDSDLAALYGVQTKNLNKAVKRNAELHVSTYARRASQFEVPIWNLKSSRRPALPSVRFHGAGVAMLSSVLNSERAVKVNIAIMRAFVKLRETLDANRELARKFAELEMRVGKHDVEIAAILEAIRQLMAPPEKPRREIRFHVRERTGRYRVSTRA